MSVDTFEYAIRKDVRNNPIVREIDRERQRELWHTAGLAAFLVLVVLFRAGLGFERLSNGYRLDRLEEALAAEAEINRHLRLEIDTLRSPARIEPLATQQLGMVRPRYDETVVIERVLASAPPLPVMARR